MGTIGRRNFLKISGLAASSTLFSMPAFTGCNTNHSNDQGEVSNLFTIFQDPPPEARPFFRWWWNGNNVNLNEIIRELDLMKKAGIGGVEINPVEMPEQITGPEREGLVWLSDEWIKVLKGTLREAEKRNMIADLIVGTGWPFGGEFLKSEETIQGLHVKTKELTGPGIELVELPGIDPENERYLQIILFPGTVRDISDGIDYTDAIEQENSVELELSPGKNILYITMWRNKFRTVMHGAPGGAGPVLDHFNRKAVQKYLNNMSDKLNPALEGKMGNCIRSMFCDSIELAGANWTGDFEDEFRKRRNYSILPYISLLLDPDPDIDDQFQEVLNRVRYDYSKTLSELFTERFIIPYHNWCNENGTLSRYQAYGFPWLYTDLVDGYLIPDIPEGDQWLFNPGWSNAIMDDIRYAIWNKYASSGGHLTGKDIISTEAMTNTSGVFEGTLEYQKQATDLNIITGINHQVLHGFNYSPPDTVFPGWIRYGGYYNENNTWWPYMHLLSDYMARLASIFQHSKPDLHVALMAPTADAWSQSGLDRNTYNNTPWYIHSIWQALNHNGVCSDYVSSKIIREGTIERGRINYGPMAYDTLILCEVSTIEPDAIEKLMIFTKGGGKLIFLGKAPKKSAGLAGMTENDAKVCEAVEQTLNTGAILVNAPGEKEKQSQQAFAEWAQAFIKDHDIAPELEISNPDYKFFMIKHATEQEDIFFLANMDRSRSLSLNCRVTTEFKYPWIWDAETGERKSFMQDDNRQIITTLNPLESKLLAFSNEKPGEIEADKMHRASSHYELSGPWDVRLEWGPVMQMDTIRLDKLVNLADIQEFCNFAGTATYSVDFITHKLDYMILDLGTVYDIAEVILNGHNLGVKWWGNRLYTIHGLLQESGNTLIIKVTNRLFNYVKSLSDNPVAQFWTERSRTNVTRYPTGLIGPVRLL